MNSTYKDEKGLDELSIQREKKEKWAKYLKKERKLAQQIQQEESDEVPAL
jgi:hypothetical protein